MNDSAPGTTGQDSRNRPASRGALAAFALGLPPLSQWLLPALAIAGFVGGGLLVVSDFLTLFEVRTEAGVTIPDGAKKGYDNHSFAMVLVGLLSLVLAYGAWAGESRPAMAALAALGLVALVVAVGFDLPDATGTNTRARTFENVTGHPRVGFYVETLGAVLLLLSGGSRLILSAPSRPDPRPRARDEAAD